MDIFNSDGTKLFESSIVLQNSNGKNVKFNCLDVVEVDGNDYVVLAPYPKKSQKSAPLTILRYMYDDEKGIESYSDVESQEIINKVYEIFKERFKDELEFKN